MHLVSMLLGITLTLFSPMQSPAPPVQVNTGPSIGIPNVQVMDLDSFYAGLVTVTKTAQGVSGLYGYTLQHPPGWTCDIYTSPHGNFSYSCYNGVTPNGSSPTVTIPSTVPGMISCLGYTNQNGSGLITSTTLLCADAATAVNGLHKPIPR